ncbi:MAG: Hsp20/alpha crystallin family protein [Bacteroidota bacterium]|jgi:HSP20 family protein|nr:Hsp20/alpha crystallin family protein [Bacteroidota bacterium]
MQYNTKQVLFNQDRWMNTLRGMHYAASIPVNIYETMNAFEIELMAPGRNKANFEIKADNGLLTIAYQPIEKTENQSKKIVQQEFMEKPFKKVFSLNENISTDQIEATYQNGILKISLPLKTVKAPVNRTIAVA